MASYRQGRRERRAIFSEPERISLVEDDLDDGDRKFTSLEEKVAAVQHRADQILQALVIGALLMAANLAVIAYKGG